MRYVRKAALAAGFTLVAAFGTAMLDGDLTRSEAVASLGAALVAGGVVYRVPNTPKV